LPTPQPEDTPTPTPQATSEESTLPPTQTPEATPEVIVPSFTAAPPAATYRVRPGDSLSVIAERYGLSVRELMEANKLRSTNIYVDQRLVIPSK
jgi:LysM repeat protein